MTFGMLGHELTFHPRALRSATQVCRPLGGTGLLPATGEARFSVTPVGTIQAVTLLLFLVTFLAVSEFPPSRVLAQSAHHAQLIEGAKKEGQLNWYTSMSVVDHTKYLELFNKKYPFVKVNV